MKHNRSHKKHFILLTVLAAVVLLFTACAAPVNTMPPATTPAATVAAEETPVSPPEPQAEQPAEQKSASAAPAPLTRAEAKEIVFGHLGISEADATLTRTELDAEDGILSYEVELVANGTEYDYDIDAFSGEILKAEQEPLRNQNQQTAEKSKDNATQKQENKQTNNNNDQSNKKQPAADTAYIGKDKAEELALKDAGISAENARVKYTDLDKDREGTSYEVEFTADGIEYEYDIDAETGKILKKHQEYDDDRFDDDRFDDDRFDD